jgi:hypothetical protein
LLESIYPDARQKKERGDAAAQTWLDSFEALGKKLAVKVP